MSTRTITGNLEVLWLRPNSTVYLCRQLPNLQVEIPRQAFDPERECPIQVEITIESADDKESA